MRRPPATSAILHILEASAPRGKSRETDRGHAQEKETAHGVDSAVAAADTVAGRTETTGAKGTADSLKIIDASEA